MEEEDGRDSGGKMTLADECRKADWPDCCIAARKAADRIEALEAEVARQKEYIATFHTKECRRIEALEAALQEIASEYTVVDGLKYWEKLARCYEDIARRALEGK